MAKTLYSKEVSNMAKHHNLGTVISFEFIRTIKKPSFWAATLALPALLLAVFAIAFYSGKTGYENAEKLAKEKFSVVYKDDSGVVLDDIAAGVKAKKVDNKGQAIEDVKNQKVDAFFYYPKDTTKEKVEIYGKDAGLFDNGKYAAVAESILKLSANATIDDSQLISIAKGEIASETTTYTEDGEVSAGWMAAVPPLIFLVLFYFTVALLGNNLLNSTVEEKENRVTEMILTTLNPTNLIVGKLIATFMAGIVQAIVLVLPVVIAYLVLGSNAASANLPDLAMAQDLVIDPATMAIGLFIFIGGLLVFTGTLVALGAIMPTAKEAGQWFGIAILLMFIPFYILQVILSDPDQMVVSVFTYFPYTAPVTAMLRNAFGSLSAMEAAIVITGLLILGALIIRLAVRLFRYGAMEYGSKLSIKRLFQ